MKVLRSKCRTRVIFAKNDREVITSRIEDIAEVRLIDGEIRFLRSDASVIAKANWEAVEVPETFTALEKVIHLIEWLACDDKCSVTCKDYHYDTLVDAVGFTYPATDSTYDENYILPLSYTFGDDLSCDSVWEVHLNLAFVYNSMTAAVTQLWAFLDELPIEGVRAFIPTDTSRFGYSASLHFMVEGDASGKTINFGVTHLSTSTRTVEDVFSTLIVRKVR